MQKHFRIGHFSEEQNSFVMGGSALNIDQGQIKELTVHSKAVVLLLLVALFVCGRFVFCAVLSVLSSSANDSA